MEIISGVEKRSVCLCVSDEVTETPPLICESNPIEAKGLIYLELGRGDMNAIR